MKPEEAETLKEKEQEEQQAVSGGNPDIESIQIKNEDLDKVESLQDKISKGLRDIFGSRRMEETEESVTVPEETEEVQEEMLRNPSSEKEYANVPELEPESGKSEPKVNLSDTIKMPTLDIPDSMKNMNPAETEVPKAPVQNNLFSETEVSTKEDTDVKEEPDMGDFNLEDTILAAATAQGIEIPKEKEVPEKTVEVKEEKAEPQKEGAPEEKPAKAKPVVQLEEEEFLSEEDLQAAEDEFLNGPVKKETKTFDKSMSEDDFVASMLKESGGEDEDLPSEEEEEFAVTADEPEEESEDVAAVEDAEEEPEEPAKTLTEEEELEQFIDSIHPKKKRNPVDIIPREKMLTDDEKKLFTYFVKVPGMKEQLVSALCDAQMAAADKTSKTGNIIVMGGRETGKTRLIASLIPAICKELNLQASKVAYVFADQLNEMDLAKVVSKLAGGFLVIEGANQLTQETVEFLDKAMEFRTDGLTVIIEDEKIGMRKLMARFPKFAKKFTSMINIPVFTNDELVNFARVYTKENGFKIDQMGMLALYNLIGVNQKEDQPMNIGAVKEMLDNAMARSQGGLLKFNKKKRVDRDGYTVLYEKDFAK